MVEFAEKITLKPSTIVCSDVENLRTHGFDDRAILEIVTVSAYRNYIARIASALGVEVDESIFRNDPEVRARLEEGLA